jgi:O-antigen ligase
MSRPNTAPARTPAPARRGEQVFCALLVVAVLPYGAIDLPVRSLLVLLFSGFLGWAALTLRPEGARRPVVDMALFIAAALCLWSLLQAVSLPQGWLRHESWRAYETALEAVRGAISVDPDSTLRAIPALALPFMAFIGVLLVFRDGAAALRLVRFVSYMGAAIALFSIGEQSLGYGTLLLGEKQFYLDSLTGTFINRNTAASYFGLVAILLAALCLLELKSTTLPEIWRIVFNPWAPKRGPARSFVVHAALLGLLLVALALTRSRAGLASALAGLLMFWSLALPHRFAWLLAGSRGLRAVKIAFSLGVLGLLLYGIAGQTLFRASVEGISDPARTCIYRATWSMIQDHWITGSGLGTFDQLYPAYRRPECANIWYVVNRAHNVYLEGIQSLGLIFPLALAMGAARVGRVLWRGTTAQAPLRLMPMAGCAILLQTALHSAVDFAVQIPGFSVIFAVALAATLVFALLPPVEPTAPGG